MDDSLAGEAKLNSVHAKSVARDCLYFHSGSAVFHRPGMSTRIKGQPKAKIERGETDVHGYVDS